MPATSTKQPKKKLQRFRLKRGGHADPTASLIDKKGNTIPSYIRNDSGNLRPNPEVNEGRGFEPGDVIEIERDLLAQFGSAKFSREGADSVTQTPIDPSRFLDQAAKDLNKLDDDALRERAEEEEVDISDLSKKKDIIERIVNSRLQ